MKNIKKILNYLLASALFAAVLISCNDDSSITGIKIDKEELLLAINGTATLTANLVPLSATNQMQWSSSNSSVAVVESNDKAVSSSKGAVTAKSAGTATIKVTTKSGKHIAECIVTVIDPQPELILVEGGVFTMGCTDGEGEDHEFPVHEVTLSSFKMAKYEVTQQQWEAVMGSNPSYFKGVNNPVENVSWNNAQEFIKNLNALTGKKYRLPTEAEWEYAARGGKQSKGYKYSGSDDINAVAWYTGNTSQPVGTKAPNELGIYDMSGNVFEMCNDWYGAYTEGAQTNPQGATTGTRRITRGGSHFNFGAYGCRVSYRISLQPGNSGIGIGFRLAHPEN